jgi:hypothetical protein
MANFFKTRFLINPDGSDSATAITNTNTAFVHTYIGDDLTGDGTREFPFKSVFKANQKSGVAYIVFRGVVNESFSATKMLIGDDINQNLIMSNYVLSPAGLANMTVDVYKYTVYYGYPIYRVIVTLPLKTYQSAIASYSKLQFIGSVDHRTSLSNCTIINCAINQGNDPAYFTPINCIVVSEFDLVHFVSGYKYIVFLSTTIFKLNGVNIIQPIWSNDSKHNMELLRSAYVSAGVSLAAINIVFPKDSFDNETCMIVKETRSGGVSANVFNRYNVDGSVADYSLNPNLYNAALYASDTGSFVGCFRPADAVVSADWNAAINVNDDGSDTVNAGTLLRINGDDTIDFNTASGQIWNRLKCNQTIVIPNGIKFDGTPVSSNDGSAFGYYFGKHQDLMNHAALTPADALEPNCIYKVCNPLRSIYQAAIFNGNQYLPDYFFKTGAAPLAFTLLNEDSGTVVKKVLAVPMESIEVIPYDDIATPSVTFPRFSSPMFGSCYMLYHKIGARIDGPVLFSEVANDKIAYYDAWAVTNADQEFATLMLDTVNYYYKIPVLKYLRPELNGHFNADYDQ